MSSFDPPPASADPPTEELPAWVSVRQPHGGFVDGEELSRRGRELADPAVADEFVERLAALLVEARRAGVEVAEDLLGNAIATAAVRLGGIEELLYFRNGSWEAEHVRSLGDPDLRQPGWRDAANGS